MARDRSLPRARGDQPWASVRLLPPFESSPRARGSTLCHCARLSRGRVFPARAGINRAEGPRRWPRNSLPRARGDQPSTSVPACISRRSSPRARGSTLMVATDRNAVPVFPARAGINPRPSRAVKWRQCLPRARGDQPPTAADVRAGFKSSPRARGSTPFCAAFRHTVPVFPARAGINPTSLADSIETRRLPRARGDQPQQVKAVSAERPSSPRARGSTQSPSCLWASAPVFPARAGINPDDVFGWYRSFGLPRARGDQPCRSAGPPGPFESSPRARGSTRASVTAVLDVSSDSDEGSRDDRQAGRRTREGLCPPERSFISKVAKGQRTSQRPAADARFSRYPLEGNQLRLPRITGRQLVHVIDPSARFCAHRCSSTVQDHAVWRVKSRWADYRAFRRRCADAPTR